MEDRTLFFEVMFRYDPSQQTTTCLKLGTEVQEQALNLFKAFV